MINAISGELLYVRSGKAVVSTSFGIEFELMVSARTAAALLNLKDEDKKRVRLLAYLQHREDAMTLFGFLTDEEKDLYLELTKISGIGSRQALKILSGLSIAEFYGVLDSENVKALSKIPGMGLKTAQKIVLALKDKLVPIQKAEKPSASLPQTRYPDVVESLTDMGFDRQDAVAAVNGAESRLKDIGKMTKGEREEAVFREAFALISKNG